jgi:hypothetical protein
MPFCLFHASFRCRKHTMRVSLLQNGVGLNKTCADAILILLANSKANAISI